MVCRDMSALTGQVTEAFMNEALPQVLDEAAERRGRFISDNLRRVFVQIYRIVGNVDDAQDLTQEAFIKALQRSDQLKDTQKAAHWLSRIATNTAIDFLRRSGRRNRRPPAPTPRWLRRHRDNWRR